eukprot:TRINITY_DN4585_c0_g1_i1.p1 TRINITY_DN4585_c0_g1~~TRINITY_DN4585_c0_g1_i1.p1  ORF type:complete len:340 (+),score=52.26 TRINITY_DN4585_c0_g1_i1:77-1021(+)
MSNEIKDGKFERPERTFRDSISTKEGAEFPPDSNRYHLYVALSCPWAHRTLVVRALKGLEDAITVDVTNCALDKSKGWEFNGTDAACTKDTVHGFSTLKEVYLHSKSDYSASVTVPVLYDKQKRVVINNESSEIIRQLNSELNSVAKNPNLDLYPPHLREKIDEVNSWIYSDINNGVYKAGFATTQEAYESAVTTLFASLEKVEKILSQNRYLCGEEFTEADVRLFTTLLRFDVAYFGLFKCNLKRLVEFPNIWNYTKEIYQVPAVKKTVNLDHIKKGYYNMVNLNPHKIVPVGPEINFEEPHDRNRLPSKSSL